MNFPMNSIGIFNLENEVKDDDNLDEIGMRIYFFKLQMYANIGDS